MAQAIETFDQVLGGSSEKIKTCRKAPSRTRLWRAGPSDCKPLLMTGTDRSSLDRGRSPR